MKKILYITTIGSTMGFFPALIRTLLDDGHTVDIATNENGGETPVPACYREWDCRVYSLSCSRSPMERGNLAAIHEIKKIVQSGQYDIVHCHTPIVAACTRVACKGLRRNGAKVIYTAHGFHFYTGAPLKNWLLYYPIEWLCAHWTDTLITINHEDYERAKKHLHAKRVEYVPGVGIDTKRFANAKIDHAAKRRELGVPKDAVLLLSVGELSHDKNHEVVLRALQKLNDRTLHFAIAGQGSQREYLQNLSQELGIADRFHLLGFRRDVAELLAAADCFVFPSIFEGLPVSIMEAMAAGVPIVCSSCRGNTDLVTDKNYQFKFNSVDQLADAITYALNHDNQAYIAENRKRLQIYQKDNVIEKMKRIYQEASGNGST